MLGMDGGDIMAMRAANYKTVGRTRADNRQDRQQTKKSLIYGTVKLNGCDRIEMYKTEIDG